MDVTLKVQIRYRKKLKMTPGKLAAQVAHVVIGFGVTDKMCTIIVLGVSDSLFESIKLLHDDCYVHADLGYTEVNPGEETCLGYVEATSK